ncbi:MAG: hypothetical protein ACRDZ4_21110 [Egibacteraceae bacterium]
MTTSDDLRTVAAICVEALRSAVDLDWDVRAGDLQWTARRTIDHIPDVLLFYSGQLAARADRRLPFPRNSDPDASVDDLIELVGVAAAILAEVAVAAGPSARAFHPAGRADASGFLGMGCDELLVHTGDIAHGLRAPFAPPAQLCQRVVERLFPWAPGDFDPWATLRWANGRAALPGHDRLDPDWYWHCAPIDEWDGTVARRTRPPGWT